MPEFKPWPKLARLNRDIVITEKIDGTNAAVGITEDGEVYAQSRTRIITPQNDNYGFARWVEKHAESLTDELGPGLHFGEWWGRGIQRGYGLTTKRFSLFNVARFRPALHRDDLGYKGIAYEDDTVLDIVPVLYEGPFSQDAIDGTIRGLRTLGSIAVPGYMDPEGIVVFHTAANTMFKVTLKDDGLPKSVAEAMYREGAAA